MKTLGTALRGTNVKSQMLSFQIFTGLRAISSLQINGAIGNERGQRGPRQSRLLGTTNPDFLVSRGHTRTHVISRTLMRAVARVRSTRARALLSIRPRGCSATTRGVAVRKDYRLGENKTADIFRHDSPSWVCIETL